MKPLGYKGSAVSFVQQANAIEIECHPGTLVTAEEARLLARRLNLMARKIDREDKRGTSDR